MINLFNKLKIPKNNLSIILSGIFACLFFIFLIVIAKNIRATSDDLWFYYNVSEKGWLNALLDFEFNRRWFSFALFNFIAYLSNDFTNFQQYLFIYYLITFIILYIVSFRFFKVLLNKFFTPHLPGYYVLILSSVFVIAFYFTTTNAIEVWFWPIASTIYLYSVLFFMLGVSELLINKNNLKTYLATFTFFIFLGGTAENFALIAFALIIYFEAVNFINTKRLYPKNLIAIISTAIFPIINIFSQGVKNRIEFEIYMLGIIPNKTFAESMSIYFNMPRLSFFAAILLLVFCIAIHLKQKGFSFNYNAFSKIKTIVVIGFIFIAGTFVPLVLVFGNLGPSRAWVPLSFIICLLLFILAIYTGSKLHFHRFIKHSSTILNITAIVCIFILSLYFIKQKRITDIFSKAYDDRIEHIQGISQITSDGNYLIVEKLPDSGILSSQELSKKDDIIINLTSLYLGKVLGKNATIFIENSDSDGNN